MLARDPLSGAGAVREFDAQPPHGSYRYVWLYLAVFAPAAPLAAGVGPRLGLYLDLGLLVACLMRGSRLGGRERELHVALAVLPLVRTTLLVVPPVGEEVRPFLLVVPPLLGTLLAAHALRYRGFGVRRALRLFPVFAGAGVLVGVLVGVLTAAFVPAWGLPSSLPPAALALSAALDELLFRGVLLTAAVGLLGPQRGVLWTALLYAGFFLGQPWGLVGLALLVGVGFGWLALRTRSVAGAALAHALAAVTPTLLPAVAPTVVPILVPAAVSTVLAVVGG